jgi:hypothetical protein
MIHSLIIFIVVVNCVTGDQINPDGYEADLWVMSIILYTNIIFVVNIKIFLNTQYWTKIHTFVIFFSSIIPYLCYIAISSVVSGFMVY